MFSFIFELLGEIWHSLLAMLGFGRSRPSLTNHLEVFVRTNTGEMVTVQLDPCWTVAKVKSTLAPKINTPSHDLRIIFAGKELPDDLLLQQCDLGNRSVLHAVRVVAAPRQAAGGEPLPPPAAAAATAAAAAAAAAAAEVIHVNEVTPTEAATNVDKKDLESNQKTQNETKSLDENSTLKEKSVEGAGASSGQVSPGGDGGGGAATGGGGRPEGSRRRLLCDASTVITIQMSEADQKAIHDLKSFDSEVDRPHFYVYCVRPCNSVQVGKLRVRCAACRQGALTLHRDPCNWQDVLQPSQISATCETVGCGGSEAEFFFKCRGHETSGEDDTSVALYLVRANLPGVSCLACSDISSPVVVFECRDAHVMCLDCFITFCISRLNERQFVQSQEFGYTLSCPIGCSESLIKEVHHFKLMGDNHYERYQRWGTEEAVLAAGGVLCPYPGCGQGIIPDEECRRVVCVAGCGYVFCRHCLQGYHIGECHPDDGSGPNFVDSSGGRFAVDPSKAAGSRWDEASSLAIRITTKPCPKCRTPTERDGGCMHMVCTRATCNFHWCWVCQTEWTRECMGAHWFG